MTSALSGLARAALRSTATAIGPRADRVIPAWRSSLTRGLTIFIFHEITDSPSLYHRTHATSISTGRFREQIGWITSRFTVLEPHRLPQLGGNGALPSNAALVTFDDSWAGVFRTGLPVLREQGIPALCLLNMGAVSGHPDLPAVRAFEESTLASAPLIAPGARLDAPHGEKLVDAIRDRYAEDAEFRAYQGPTATVADLAKAATTRGVWFGSHLYDHWNLRTIGQDLYVTSLEENAAALSEYPNALPVLGTPNGYAGGAEVDLFAVPARADVRVFFVGTGNQNRDPAARVLDRVFCPPDSSRRSEWWYATHRRRVLGRRTS